jgi:tyrosine-protein kinase Etk/Wzc
MTMIDLRFPGEELNTETAGSPPPISMLEVLTELALGKWLIAKVVLGFVFAGVILCMLLPVRYTAITKIMPPQQAVPSAAMFMNQMANSGSGSLAAAAGMGLGLKNPNDIYIGLLNSRPIADAIIHQFDLAKLYRARDMTAARKKLADVTLIVSEKNGFIAVSVTDRDRRRAAGMANAYTNELRLLTKTLAVTEASQRRLFYEDQLKQAKDALLTAELSFQQIQQNKGLVELDAQAKAMIESLAMLRAQVAAREVEVQALRSYSTERNPDLALAERQLSSLKEEAAQLEQRSHSPGSAVLGLGDVPGAGMEYLRAEHELKYRQTMFDLLLKQYDAAKLDESKDAAIIQVVEPAIEPDRKSSPQRALIVFLFAAAGFLAGAVPVLFSWWKRTVQSDPHIAKQIGNLRRAITGRTEPV